MPKKGLLTKILAIIGTGLVWLPILAPVIFSILLLMSGKIFRFDYLMPAEFFPLVLAGGGLLLWAALRAHELAKLISWSLAAAVSTLVISQVLAIVTGLASGSREANGLPRVVVVLFLAAYNISIIGVGISGALLLHDLFSTPVDQR